MMVGQFTSVIKQANPNIPKQLLDTLPAIVNSVIDEDIPTFKQAAVLIYHKHFSHDELKQMIAFYSTDLGGKTIRVMPTLLQESMQAGQQWGSSWQSPSTAKLQSASMAFWCTDLKPKASQFS